MGSRSSTDKGNWIDRMDKNCTPIMARGVDLLNGAVLGAGDLGLVALAKSALGHIARTVVHLVGHSLISGAGCVNPT